MKSPCYLVTLSLESSDFQTFLKQYVILVPFGALIIFLSLQSLYMRTGMLLIKLCGCADCLGSLVAVLKRPTCDITHSLLSILRLHFLYNLVFAFAVAVVNFR